MPPFFVGANLLKVGSFVSIQFHFMVLDISRYLYYSSCLVFQCVHLN